MGENSTMCESHRPFIKLKNESGSENTHYSVFYEGLPEEFKRVAERELNETEENRRRGLQKLKDYTKRKYRATLEDYILLAVLRSCKYNLKKCESKLDHFLTKRRELIGMLTELDTSKIEEIIDHFPFGILPYRDKNGRGIVYTRPYGMNEDRFEVHNVGVMLAVSVLFLMKFPISSVVGFAYYGECKSDNLYIFYPILRTFKQIMFYLVSLHGYGYSNLHKLYNPNILPEEFGGTMGPLSNTVYKQKLMDFIEDLKKERI